MERMELIYSVFIYASCFTLTTGAPQGTKNFQFPFPTPVRDLPPFDSATPFYTFDGIDYDELPESLKAKHNDCYGEHIRCIQNRNYFHMICSYNVKRFVMGEYYSHCEIELRACFIREGYNNVFGKHYYDDPIFFAGEGQYCRYSDIRDEEK